MPVTTGSHPKQLWPGVEAFFGATYAEKPTVYSQVFEVRSSRKSYEEVVEEESFGLAPVMPQGDSVSYDTDKQGYVTRFTNVTYGLGSIVTREAIDDNQYFDVAQRKAAKLARSMRQTKENVHANILNNGFTAAVGGDGVALLADNHPTSNGTQSNELAVSADLSEASLEDILIQVRQAKDSRGLRIQLEGQKLVVPSDLGFEATRIVSSVNQSGTANNDINAMRAMGMLPGGIVIWDYLSDADAWFVVTDAPDGLISFQRKDLALTQDNDFDTENARMKAMERYVPKWGDWRGIYGSPGA